MKNNYFILFSALVGLTMLTPSAHAEEATESAKTPTKKVEKVAKVAAPSGNITSIPSPASIPRSTIQKTKKVELIDGSWALVEGNRVKISKDQGRNWTPAKDRTWVAKDGSKLTTRKGKILR